jgi:hypothetical protein
VRVLEIASRLFGRQKNSDTQEALFRCPEPDCGRDKLYVNGSSGAFYCVRCEHAGNVLRMTGQMSDMPIEPDPVRILIPPTLRDVRAESLHSPALITYMLHRGFTEQMLYDLQIKESDFFGEIYLRVTDESGDVVDSTKKWINLQGAVIFPIYDGGYRGYQARYIYATDKDKRWMSAPGVKRKTMIYNADRAFGQENDYYVVTEGIPASCAFGPHGVATFGKGFTDAQVARLAAAPQKLVYVAYDGDAQAESNKLGTILAETGKMVRVVPFTGKEDPDTVPDLEERMKRATPPDPYYMTDLAATFHSSYRKQRSPSARPRRRNRPTSFARRLWR